MPMPDDATPVAATRLFQINEEDLETLERVCPDLCQALFPKLAKDAPGAKKLRIQLGKVKEILSHVRWGYGPPEDVVVIPAGDEP